MQAQRWLSETMILGECPVWDDRTRTLYWIDITAGQLWRCAPDGANPAHEELGQLVGSCCLAQSRGVIVALEKSIVWLRDGGRETLAEGLEPDRPLNRLNDGKCDRQGRLLIGSMHREAQPGQAALYQLSPEGRLRTLLTGVTISNGLDWSPDGRTLYYADTPTGVLWAFDYEPETGELTRRRALVDGAGEEGAFDGLCVDAEGCLWVCHWGGFQVSRRDPRTGKKIGGLRLPVPNVTCCCFGGEKLNHLYLTTGTGRDARVKRDYPLSGSLYVCEVDTAGLPAGRFAR